MKNATKHADKLSALYRSLKRGQPEMELKSSEPLEALVRGAMSYDVPDNKANEAMRLIQHEFVDLNELRVATDLEIQELLGVRYPAIEERVGMITRCLNAIFELEHTLSLDRLKTVSNRDARAFLRQLPDVHPFVEAFVMIAGLGASAMPVDAQILQYLKEEGVIEETATMEEAQRFVEHHLKADEVTTFFLMVRRAVYDEKLRRKSR